jgi:hypothetical protein
MFKLTILKLIMALLPMKKLIKITTSHNYSNNGKINHVQITIVCLIVFVLTMVSLIIFN